MSSHRSKPWFAVKRYGMGAGMPIAWQGWALLALFFAILALANIYLDHQGARTAVIVTAAVLLSIVAFFRTDGDWRWRWGDDR
ncbi:hypothetical protein J2Y58_000442 [Sphingomonas sp. BE138]|uniref:hypothetical protein n=1 Tax=Sphingomonas sp. BE138 TaxID=2817845 RepID=UPI0028571F32|nr:hypothetical protein [Sphingomonas sp. BE138]MDR6787104.1 hypothetical protein [Sphingomonas sp. BE138]